MSIRQRIDDACFLSQAGRYEGALLSALVAVEATARKRYPKGTALSRHRVNKKTAQPEKMGDGEAFRTFLADELPKYTPFTNPPRMFVGKSAAPMPQMGPVPPLPVAPDFSGDPNADTPTWAAYQDALDRWFDAFQTARDALETAMEDYRCKLEPQMMSAHEVFWKLCRCGLCHAATLPDDLSFFDEQKLVINCGDDCLRLSTAWIQFLIAAVVKADENRELFPKERT